MMCKENSTCIHPENLKGELKNCSGEQIAICHPGERGHPCEPEESKKK